MGRKECFWHEGRLWVFDGPFQPPQLAAVLLREQHADAAIDRLQTIATLELAREKAGCGPWTGEHGAASENADWPLYQRLFRDGWKVVPSPFK
jgi:predicted phosphoadenosine phosphosulfate sulfurtransferase